MGESPPPLRLALVIEHFDPRAGGNERSTAQIAAALIERGHHVTVLCASGSEDHGVEGVELVRMAEDRKSSSAVRLLRFARWAKAALARGDYDAGLSMTMAVPAGVVQPRGGTVRETLDRNIAMRPTAAARWAKRAMLWLSPKQRVMLALERRTTADPAVRRLVAISGYVADQLDRHYAVPEDRIDVIPNAAVMPPADAAQRAQWRRALRAGLGVPEGSPLYLFAAQNPRLKGISTLMRALRLLVDRGREPVVMMVGGIGYAHQDWAAAVGLRDRVRLLGATRQMPALYAAADATVLPTFYDPASKVVIESLMMGTPAISTAYNGASDLIAPEGGQPRGLVLDDPADAEALAQAMERIVEPDAQTAYRAAMAGLADQLSMGRHVSALERTLRAAAQRAPLAEPIGIEAQSR